MLAGVTVRVTLKVCPQNLIKNFLKTKNEYILERSVYGEFKTTFRNALATLEAGKKPFY
jgi:hypothetical protein